MPKTICDYITAYAIIKHKWSTSSETDGTPLKRCLLDVGQLMELCSRRGWIGRILHSSQDRKDMENVDWRLGNMRDYLGLASITTVGVMIHDLKAQMVSAAEVGGHIFNVCIYSVFIRVECNIGQHEAPRISWVGCRKDMENVDRRLGNMRDYLGLASITTVGVMIHDLKAQMVSAAEVGGHIFNVCIYSVFIRVECHIGQHGAPRISWVGCTSWGTILDLPSSPTGGK